ncbi:hypothetical protein COOONC_25897, partial [Cooperia oncophora]
MILEECQCMDPRYPVAPGAITCELAKRSCIDEAVAKHGDPSTWDSCVCPLPCTNQQYSVEWHRTQSASEAVRCMNSSINDCEALAQDDVLITVTLPRLEYQVFGETPTMDVSNI